jgi:hypothetical protein
MLLVLVVLAAAHEGEEFVIALPAIMLAGAFFLMRWANQGDEDKASGESSAAASDVEAESDTDAGAAADDPSAADVVGSTRD